MQQRLLIDLALLACDIRHATIPPKHAAALVNESASNILSHACLRMQKFQDDPKIVYCRALLEKGAHVTCVEDGLPTWVAEVISSSLIRSTLGTSCAHSVRILLLMSSEAIYHLGNFGVLVRNTHAIVHLSTRYLHHKSGAYPVNLANDC